MWAKSNLQTGDRIRISEEMLVSKSGDRFLRAEYESETRNGINLRLFFEPNCTEDASYRVFISWVSIHCGSVKLKDFCGNDIRAKEVKRCRR